MDDVKGEERQYFAAERDCGEEWGCNDSDLKTAPTALFETQTRQER